MKKEHYLGKRKYTSPLAFKGYVQDKKEVSRAIYLDEIKKSINTKDYEAYPAAGPRKEIFFKPGTVRATIVTCGGLCPGLNNIIRDLTMSLFYHYKAKEIFGIRFGFQGFIPEYGHEPIKLTPKSVSEIHLKGGTILGSSRGPQDISRIADFLEDNKIDMLFAIGGDGTLHGAMSIYKELSKRKTPISVIGVPKTIDNDLNLIEKSFGFQSAVDKATESVISAHVEAKGAPHCVGLVKVMGRNSGFIACHTALSANTANYVFIPEVSIKLDGENGFLEHLEKRLSIKQHAVIIAAEGSLQDHFNINEFDASGNKKLGDVGMLLKDRIKSYFKKRNKNVNIKYIDPSYIIRSIPANSQDSVYCTMLATNAVHTAMEGYSGVVIGTLNSKYVIIPIEKVIARKKQVKPTGRLWNSILEITGQPEFK